MNNTCREIPLGKPEDCILDAPQLYTVNLFDKEIKIFTIPSYIDYFDSFFKNLNDFKYEYCRARLIMDVLHIKYDEIYEKFETSKSFFKRTLDLLESDPVFKEIIRLNDIRLSRDENIDNLLM
jgi:hypothetical protein